MKALDILKAFADRHESAYGFNNIFVASLGDIKEAIEELTSMEQRIVGLESQLRVGMNANTVLAEQLVELEAPNTCKLDCAYYDNEYGCNCPFPCTRIKDDDAKDYYGPKEQK